MFRLFLFTFFKFMNNSYKNIDENHLSKFISNDSLRNDILSKKEFFFLWRKRMNNKIINEHDSIKRIKIYKREKGFIIKTRTVHSFTIKSSTLNKKSFETLNYVFLISKFKIIDMACQEYDPDKFKRLLYVTSISSYVIKNTYKWNELVENIDSVFDSYNKYNCEASQSDKLRTNKLYSRNDAVFYARKYALNYNSYYVDFNDSGGDCTNFISQSLHAGKIPLSRVWKPYTPPWIRVNELHSYLSRNHLTIEVPSLNDLTIGDVIQFFSNSKGYFAHSGIVSEVLDNGEILYCCHTYDKLDFPLSEIYPSLYTKLRLLKISY